MPRLPYTTEVVSQVLLSFKKHQEAQENGGSNPRPFILGITGLQGCGKSTLATDIVQTLNQAHHIHAIEISLDDFYLTHHQRLHLDEVVGADPTNSLLKVRGQPGTHDAALAEMTFSQFSINDEERIAASRYLGTEEQEVVMPVFDKSLFAGDGDRVSREKWRTFRRDPPCEVVVFEGWCVGFQPGSEEEIKMRWIAAKKIHENDQMDEAIDSRFSTTTLSEWRLEDLLFVNKRLGEYCERFMGPKHMDALVHLDSMDLVNVYTWRMEQEHAMRKVKAGGMTDDQVVDFVKGYMPAYEIYLGGLREGFFKEQESLGGSKLQLHVILDKNRNLVGVKAM